MASDAPGKNTGILLIGKTGSGKTTFSEKVLQFKIRRGTGRERTLKITRYVSRRLNFFLYDTIGLESVLSGSEEIEPPRKIGRIMDMGPNDPRSVELIIFVINGVEDRVHDYFKIFGEQWFRGFHRRYLWLFTRADKIGWRDRRSLAEEVEKIRLKHHQKEIFVMFFAENEYVDAEESIVVCPAVEQQQFVSQLYHDQIRKEHLLEPIMIGSAGDSDEEFLGDSDESLSDDEFEEKPKVYYCRKCERNYSCCKFQCRQNAVVGRVEKTDSWECKMCHRSWEFAKIPHATLVQKLIEICVGVSQSFVKLEEIRREYLQNKDTIASLNEMKETVSKLNVNFEKFRKALKQRTEYQLTVQVGVLLTSLINPIAGIGVGVGGHLLLSMDLSDVQATKRKLNIEFYNENVSKINEYCQNLIMKINDELNECKRLGGELDKKSGALLKTVLYKKEREQITKELSNHIDQAEEYVSELMVDARHQIEQFQRRNEDIIGMFEVEATPFDCEEVVVDRQTPSWSCSRILKAIRKRVLELVVGKDISDKETRSVLDIHTPILYSEMSVPPAISSNLSIQDQDDELSYHEEQFAKKMSRTGNNLFVWAVCLFGFCWGWIFPPTAWIVMILCGCGCAFHTCNYCMMIESGSREAKKRTISLW